MATGSPKLSITKIETFLPLKYETNIFSFPQMVPLEITCPPLVDKVMAYPDRLSSVQFSRSVVSDSVTSWTAAHQSFLSITNSWSLLKLMTIELVMPSNHLILCRPLLLLSSIFPASGSFPMSHFFASGGQSIGVSASALILQDWFPLGWTGWISLQPKGLSRVSSNTTVQKHQFFSTQLSL